MIFKQRWIKKLGWGHGSKCCLQSRPLGLPAMLVVATDAIWHSSPTELIQGTTKYSFCVCEKPHAFSRKLLIIVVLTPCCTHWIKSSDDVWKRRNSLPQILQIFCTSSVMLCNRGVEEAVKSVCVCVCWEDTEGGKLKDLTWLWGQVGPRDEILEAVRLGSGLNKQLYLSWTSSIQVAY